MELQIGQIGSCRFQVHIGRFRVHYRGSKFGQILAEILLNLDRSWSDLSRSGQYSFISFEIWPKSHYICQDLAKISLYHQSFEFRLTDFLPEHEICDWKRDRHWAGWVLRFLKQLNWDSNQSYRIFTPATYSQPNHRSNRAIIGSKIIGLVGFFG